MLFLGFHGISQLLQERFKIKTLLGILSLFISDHLFMHIKVSVLEVFSEF